MSIYVQSRFLIKLSLSLSPSLSLSLSLSNARDVREAFLICDTYMGMFKFEVPIPHTQWKNREDTRERIRECVREQAQILRSAIVAREQVCVCVCVCACAHTQTHTDTHRHEHTHTQHTGGKLPAHPLPHGI